VATRHGGRVMPLSLSFNIAMPEVIFQMGTVNMTIEDLAALVHEQFDPERARFLSVLQAYMDKPVRTSWERLVEIDD
jgi:hypothetical protein